MWQISPLFVPLFVQFPEPHKTSLSWGIVSVFTMCTTVSINQILKQGTFPICINGVIPKWNRNSVNSGNLINHWSMRWQCGSIVVFYTRDGRFESFYCNGKYFCHWIQWSQRKHQGKTQLWQKHFYQRAVICDQLFPSLFSSFLLLNANNKIPG